MNQLLHGLLVILVLAVFAHVSDAAASTKFASNMTAVEFDQDSGEPLWVTVLRKRMLPQKRCTVGSASEALNKVFPDATVFNTIDLAEMCISFYASEDNPADILGNGVGAPTDDTYSSESPDETDESISVFANFAPYVSDSVIGDEAEDEEPEPPSNQRRLRNNNVPVVDGSWGLDRMDQNYMPLDRKPFSIPFDGTGIIVYNLDNGLNSNHVDFGGRAEVIYTNVEGQEPASVRHGSATSSQVIGTTCGVAKNATLKFLQMSSKKPNPNKSKGLLPGGYKWLLDTVKKPSVFQTSMGNGQDPTLYNDLMQSIHNAGHLVVAAAGNAASSDLKFPSGTVHAIAVGATNLPSTWDQDVDVVARFSNYGPGIAGYAPGSKVSVINGDTDDEFKTAGGTSMAAPFVTGMLTALLQKYDSDTRMALDEFNRLSVPGTDNVHGDEDTAVRMFTLGGLVDDLNGARPDLCITTAASPQPQCFDFGRHMAIGPSLYNVSLNNAMASLPKANAKMCSKLSNKKAKSRKGKVYLVKMGGCDPYKKALNAQKAGAAGVIFMNTNNDAIDRYTIWGTENIKADDISIPVAAVTKATASKLTTAAKKSTSRVLLGMNK